MPGTDWVDCVQANALSTLLSLWLHISDLRKKGTKSVRCRVSVEALYQLNDIPLFLSLWSIFFFVMKGCCVLINYCPTQLGPL